MFRPPVLARSTRGAKLPVPGNRAALFTVLSVVLKLPKPDVNTMPSVRFRFAPVPVVPGLRLKPLKVPCYVAAPISDCPPVIVIPLDAASVAAARVVASFVFVTVKANADDADNRVAAVPAAKYLLIMIFPKQNW